MYRCAASRLRSLFRIAANKREIEREGGVVKRRVSSRSEYKFGGKGRSGQDFILNFFLFFLLIFLFNLIQLIWFKMFFPSPSEILNWKISRQKRNDENKKIPISDGVDWVGVYLSEEDEIRKTYGDNIRLSKIYGESYLRKLYGYDKLVDSGNGNIIKSGGSKGKKPKRSNIKSGGSKSKEPKPMEFVVGEKLKCGVRRFLSYNGKTTHLVRFEKGVPQDKTVDFDCLSGKYVLICHFTVPTCSHKSPCRPLIDAYQELSERGYPLELVVVANLRTDVVYDLKAAFHHFYSAFSCLAIPFSDFETRDYLLSCMRVSTYSDYSIPFDSYSAILVDPEGIILQDSEALEHFFNYGSEWAPPFLPTTLDLIKKQDEVLRSKLDPMYSYYAIDEDRQQPLSLYADILRCDPFLTLHRFDAAAAAAESDVDVILTVHDLSRKYVGLYLLIDGVIMDDIKAAHDHCLANNQQLEIVLVPMPFYDEPQSFLKQLHQALTSLKIKSWFLYCCPIVVCRRLWRIFGRGWFTPGEKLIIIPPDCKSGELCGREIITKFGVDQYPFTRAAILKQMLEYVRSLTPIFSSPLFNNCPMFQNGQDFNPEQLQGKNVLLYLSWDEYDHYSLVKQHYPEIKAMGWEVVFVLLDYTDRYWNHQSVDSIISQEKWPFFNLEEMPWPYMLLSAAGGASIKKLFFPHADKKTVYLFAVGKDGKIVSRDVEYRLYTLGLTESLFDDVLEADLAFVLATMPSYATYD